MDNELVQLDSVYASPGFLLLAVDDVGERLGCVGLRALEGDGDAYAASAEVRRLFVRDKARGSGLGRRLAGTLVEQAIGNGISRLVLNTLPAMSQAIALYESMGFEQVEPYVEEPLDEVLYFALDV